tara:strand:- start:590 stop:766 length:177 start_codon:yes stop_codon:yes gene_type:complete
MASPRKKWLRRKLAETAEQEAQEAQAVEVEVQPEPVVAPKPVAGSSQRTSRRRAERKK